MGIGDAIGKAFDEAASATSTVELRLPGGGPAIRLRLNRLVLQAQAMRWSYVARNRERWVGSGDDPGPSGPLLKLLGANAQRIADAGLVEVSFKSEKREEDDWPLRVFPWEYALSAATRGLRKGPLTVIRHLRTPRHPGPGVDLARPAIVESTPGRLAQWVNADAEGALMLSSMNRPSAAEAALAGASRDAMEATLPSVPDRDPADAVRLGNPTSARLRAWLEQRQPSVVHVAGVDAHQAVSLLGLEKAHPPARVRDGIALRHAEEPNGVALVEAEEAATILCAGEAKPHLVVCNVYNSATRIAARCVAHGARHAVGYHDVIDDGLARLFCSTLYRQLAGNGGDVLDAFRAALGAVRAQPGSLRGACLVLWSATSLLAPAKARAKKAAPQEAPALPAAESVPGWQRVRVVHDLIRQFNYALLHNEQSLFRSLQIFRENVAGPIRDVQVTVDLNVGDGECTFRASYDLAAEENCRDLTRDVVLPLTSALIRTQSERIQSSLRLHVACAGQTVKEETFRVVLAPVDEWQDGQKDEWRWLPSFVLPRDPAVARVVDSAQGILRALADDPNAGFDGYQSVAPAARSDAERYGCVDKQVQAIWYAVLDVHGLSYINPPPSYGKFTQRLRTPTQLLAEKRGTCIDLALLLAACLEYVDIYPVVFLLTGHAFVGYWRSEAFHAAFVRMEPLPDAPGDGDAREAADAAEAASSPIHGPPYILGQDQHREVRRHVAARGLVPLEATWLTSRGGFESAADAGRRNLRRAQEFAALIDVRLARTRDVTPIPLLGGLP